jgi:eukaryotic-like serine/threonine-protein kinase
VAVKPGDIIRDKYRVDALIGRGGMGQVFAATDLESATRNQVAIKIVSRLLVDDVMMMRLHREAEAAARIQSDYVPRVLEVSETDGETFLAMERLVGEPLSQRIRDHGALPWSEVTRIAEDVLRGLIDAHTAGIVHRDLKPSNIFLALKAGRVRAMVLDFGVCKMDGLDTERLTGTGESIGTVAYMAPEQIRGAARVDERADLYAFGVLVFEMLAGRLPHDGPSQMAILASKLENTAARLRTCARVAIPEGTDELIARALARDPWDRFSSAQEMLKAWRGLSKGQSQPPPRPSDIPGGDSLEGPGPSPARGIPRGEALTVRTDRIRAIPLPPLAPQIPGINLGLAPHPPGDDDDLADTQDDLGAASRLAQVLDLPPEPPGFTVPDTDPMASPMASGAPPPIEPHPTQTALTTQAGTSERRAQKKSARIALLLAAASLVVGVIVVGVSFSRPDRSRHPGAPVSTDPSTSADPSAASSESTGDPDPDPASSESASFELPADPTPESSSGTPPRARPLRLLRPRAPVSVSSSPAPKTSGGPRITSQPRY